MFNFAFTLLSGLREPTAKVEARLLASDESMVFAKRSHAHWQKNTYLIQSMGN